MNLGNADSTNDPQHEELLAIYLDRLNHGEKLDREQILAEHPDSGEALLQDLEAFVGLASAHSSAPLGTLGDYTLRRQIGRGGMGVVYEAWEGSMDRRVALKILPAGIAADTKACTRFMREAQTAGKLNHPNVVGVYSTGVKEGTPWYSMEFVEGETLAQILSRLLATEGKEEQRKTILQGISSLFGKDDAAATDGEVDSEVSAPGRKTLLESGDLDLEYFARLAKTFAGVAEGLKHAHSKGVIHRDIKPSNLILDKVGLLRILDFGLARLEGQESLTVTGDFMGTVLYMSPEQAMAKRIPIDHRTDIYSLGVTLYEMLVLRPPYQGKSQQETLSKIILNDPEPLRRRNPRIPRDLETIVLKCLRKDPADRYGTAEALGQDLRRFVRGDPIEARPQTGWEKALRHLKRHRRRIAASLILILLAAAAAWMGLDRLLESRRQVRAAYDSQVQRAMLRLEFASLAQKAEAGETGFFDPGALGLRPQAGLDPVPLALSELDGAVALDPSRPDAHYHRGRALLFLGREKEALAALEAASPSGSHFVPALTLRAELLKRRRDKAGAEEALARAAGAATEGWEKLWIEIQAGWKEGRYSDLVAAYGRLIELTREEEPFVGCALVSRIGRGRAALEMKDFAQAVLDFSIAGYIAPEASEPALLMGKAWFLLGKEKEAERIFEARHEKASVPDEIAIAVKSIYLSLGRFDEALAWAGRIVHAGLREQCRAWIFWEKGSFEEALAAAKDACRLDPENARMLNTTGWMLAFRQRPDEGLALMRRAAEMQPRDAGIRSWLGQALWWQRRVEEARGELEAALAIDPDLPHAHTFLSRCLTFEGRFDEAIREHELTRQIAPLDSTVYHIGGLTFLESGRPAEALEAFDRALEMMPDSAETLRNRGWALERLGRIDEAIDAHLRGGALWGGYMESAGRAVYLLEQRGRLSEALAALAGYLERRPADPIALRLLVGFLRRHDARALAEGGDRLRDLVRTNSSEEALVRDARAVVLARFRREDRDLDEALESVIQGMERLEPMPEEGWSLDARDVMGELGQTLIEVARLLAEEGRALGPGSFARGLPYWAVDALGGAGLLGLGGEASEPSGAEDRSDLRGLYFEGAILAQDGRLQEAADVFARVVEADPDRPEPLIAMVRILEAAGDAEAALEALERRIARRPGADREVWEAWASLALRTPGHPPAALLAALPAPASVPGGPVEDLRWLLERLARGEPIRIRCGSDEDLDLGGGVVFGADRFFLGGGAQRIFGGKIEGTAWDSICQRVRYFMLFPAAGSGYRIPLPPGRYRVTLHMPVVCPLAMPPPRFDVLLEGQKVIADWSPLPSGTKPRTEARTFEVEVRDGFLDIHFLPIDGNPGISGWEIVKSA